jgi:hypothetical protein
MPPKAAVRLSLVKRAANDPKRTSIRLSKIAIEHCVVTSDLIEIQR